MSETKYLIFRLNKQKYGLPINRIDRVLDDQPMTLLPCMPPMVMGGFEHRGELIAAIDLRVRLNFEPSSLPANYLIFAGEFGRAALRVDGVDGIEAFSAEEAENCPKSLKPITEAVFSRTGKKGDQKIVILSADQIITKPIAEAISQLQTVAA
ncbi:MAG: purine-binding chemotaxis protein CheW [Fimbriimonadaceae bacterium]|nr:MAG: purine-binding chemotaxis protein CheW [Fimbriimonadaceae bacterium]